MILTTSETWNLRNQKALAILGMDKPIENAGDGIFTVRSQSGIGSYKVENDHGWKCNCPDHITRGRYCKHILAVRSHLMNELKKNKGWSAYNKGQTQEIELFDKLLLDLVSVIPEPEQKMGRPRIPLKDQVFCAIEKVYSQLSGRRSQTLLNRACERNLVSRAPQYNAISRTLLKEELTPMLHEMVRITASPLAEIEHDFAVDSSGFRTTSFGFYCKEKHGTKQKNIFLKAHICSGVKTNVVSDIIITGPTGGDSPQFEELVRNTAGTFEINEVSADKAYSSKNNHKVVDELGGRAFIPFKSNATGKSRGSFLWRKAFLFFQYHNEEFEAHYHKRSNVETTFGAIKQKLGETLKSKSWTSQVNELLCKVIAYNITVLIHEMFESGIVPDFLNVESNT